MHTCNDVDAAPPGRLRRRTDWIRRGVQVKCPQKAPFTCTCFRPSPPAVDTRLFMVVRIESSWKAFDMVCRVRARMRDSNCVVPVPNLRARFSRQSHQNVGAFYLGWRHLAHLRVKSSATPFAALCSSFRELGAAALLHRRRHLHCHTQA